MGENKKGRKIHYIQYLPETSSWNNTNFFNVLKSFKIIFLSKITIQQFLMFILLVDYIY